MNLMVPTMMVKGLAAIPFEAKGRTIAPGEIIEIAYGQALVMKAMGGITALVDEDLKHVEAQEHLRTYGADSWFPHYNQTIARVADFLAQQGFQTDTRN